jgi:hypothetical protein
MSKIKIRPPDRTDADGKLVDLVKEKSAKRLKQTKRSTAG